MKTTLQISGGTRSLKEQNRWQLWIVLAVNSIFLFGVVQKNGIRVDRLWSALTNVRTIIPVGVALVIATVLNGVLTPDAKTRLVFLRWRNALPGTRAFSVHAVSDPRIDVSGLARQYGRPLPTEPIEQNRVWYQMYKAVENDAAVRQTHRDFLLLRDYTGLAALFVLCYGTVALYLLRADNTALVYLGILVAQYVVVRHSASNYGKRLITTVLARWVTNES